MTYTPTPNPLPITDNGGSLTVDGTVAVTGTFYQATQPVSVAGTVAVSGPLTDTQIRATALPVSGTFWQATQPVSGTVTATVTGVALDATLTGGTQQSKITDGTNVATVKAASTAALAADKALVVAVSPNNTVGVTGTFWQATQPVSIASMPSTPVTGTFYQATQPVSIAASVAVTGPLTDTQLRATAVPVSLTSTTVTGTVAVTGPLTDTQIRATALPVSGTFWQATQPVSLAANTPTIAAGTAVIGKVGIDQTTPGTTNLVALAANQSVNNAQVAGVTTATGNGVVGTGVQRVAIASDNTAFTVNAAQSGTWNVGTVTTLTSITNAVTITPPTLTKGAQGATGVSTQDLKDAGRTLFSAATVIAGVAAVATEALLSLVPTRAGVAAAGATSLAVTAAKTLRVTGIIASARSSAATVLSGRVALRMNPAGAVTATSPIIAILSMTQQAAALAEAGDTCVVSFPDGLEFSGAQQIGLTQVCSGTGGVIYASIVGFEY